MRVRLLGCTVLPNLREIHTASASRVQVQTPSISGFGPRKMATCFDDRRNQEQVRHLLPDLLAQRVIGIALGYEDVNDHDNARRETMFPTAPSCPPARSCLSTMTAPILHNADALIIHYPYHRGCLLTRSYFR